METFNTATGTATIYNDQVALIRVKAGVDVVYDNALQVLSDIDRRMLGDYGIIIDRAEDYSLSPVEVYQICNSLERLKALAIVIYRPSSKPTTEIDRRLFVGSLDVFADIDTAKRWIESIVTADASN